MEFASQAPIGMEIKHATPKDSSPFGEIRICLKSRGPASPGVAMHPGVHTISQAQVVTCIRDGNEAPLNIFSRKPILKQQLLSCFPHLYPLRPLEDGAEVLVAMKHL